MERIVEVPGHEDENLAPPSHIYTHLGLCFLFTKNTEISIVKELKIKLHAINMSILAGKPNIKAAYKPTKVI